MTVKKILIKSGACIAAMALTVSAGVYSNQKIAVQQTSAPLEDAQVFILDAGHGGIDGGCSSANGDVEKNINLAIMLNLRDLLELSGCRVIVTRDRDVSIHDDGVEGIASQKSSDMDNRLEIFNSCEGAYCISIHQNLFTDAKFSGAQMFCSDTCRESSILAQEIQDQFVKFLQPDNKREIKICGKELFLCYYSKNPTVMAECGFLSNPEEAALLVTEDYQQKVAFTIWAALMQHLAGKQHR